MDIVREEEIYELVDRVTAGLVMRFEKVCIPEESLYPEAQRTEAMQSIYSSVVHESRERMFSMRAVHWVERGPEFRAWANLVFADRNELLSRIRGAIRSLLDEHRISIMNRLEDGEGDCSLCGGDKMVTRSGERVPCPLCEKTGNRIPREDLEKELVMYRERHMEGLA